MKIVFVSIWYSENMGYIENCLPASIAKLGHDVHLITSTAQVYYNHSFFEKTYGQYLGKPIVEPSSYASKGVKIHRFPFKSIKGRIIIQGLTDTIKAIKPDIVHTFEHTSIDTLRLIFWQKSLGFKLFTANHASKMAFAESEKGLPTGLKKWAWHLLQVLPGKFISRYIECCYCVTIDAGETAVELFGVAPEKVKITTLGVDTDVFCPNEAVKKSIRKQLKIDDSEFLCIFTGKFNARNKNPLLLAEAIAILRGKGLNVRGLFIGEGDQKEAIEKTDGSIVLPFMQHTDLPQYYQSADAAVFPFSVSNSQIDAVAVGLNLIICDDVESYQSVESTEPFSEGTAYKPKIVSAFFKYPSVQGLADAVEKLIVDEKHRNHLAKLGFDEITHNFSWDAIAARRVDDYQKALKSA